MLRAERGGINCNLTTIDMSSQGYNLQHLKENVGSSTIIYIRPMQSSLSLTKVISKADDSIKSNCQYCLKQISLANMKQHLEDCMAGAGSSSATAFHSECDDSSGEDADTAEDCKFPVLLHTQSQREEWKETLKSMFPCHTAQQIGLAVIGVSSIEEAIAELLESSPEEVSEQPKAKKHKPLPGNINLSLLLREFRDFHAEAGFEEMSVSRDALWLDMLRYYKRKVQDTNALAKTFEVSFKGEEGLDGGALKIEFFNLAWDEVKQRLFSGNPPSLLPIKDIKKLFLFQLAGTLLVHTVMQNGPTTAFPKLAKPVILSLLGKDASEVISQLSKHDIPLCSATENLHLLIEKLDSAKQKEEIDAIMEGNQKSEAYWQMINAIS